MILPDLLSKYKEITGLEDERKKLFSKKRDTDVTRHFLLFTFNRLKKLLK